MGYAVRKLGLSFALALAGATAALSVEVGTQPGAAQTQGDSMKEFMAANPDCMEFNDQCSFCAVVNGVAECSTPQIACVKQKIQCTKRAGK
ncbi:hypothetical protein [Sinorhizobium mexicanum]|uniref:Uncharacterized protein n=1 Tax=Sinorhizobium mexicanum TaxID=375549 RepID=A0A859QJ06_9HYPH|nr:hypothetical protein [Sinorhizobium mexicanum]MBP1882397.1 hypothetical protein [Sinorhizobium mexicanum]QLL62100.1 hypothetical protein FKV68_11860 [Sinorhizobium mexicanum]